MAIFFKVIKIIGKLFLLLLSGLILFLLLLFFISPKEVSTEATTDKVTTTGIKFPKHATIKIERETLTISPKHGRVVYSFKNLTNQAITTTVYFPFWIKDYYDNPQELNDAIQNKSFDDFSAMVNGTPVKYQAKMQAMLNGKDLAPLLMKQGIPFAPGPAEDACDCEGCPEGFTKWQNKANHLGLLNEDGNPLWKMQIIYYWTQTFPANKIVNVTEDYQPLTAHDDTNSGFHSTQYIVAADSNWAEPIGTFTVTLNNFINNAIAYNHFYGNNKPLITQKTGQTQVVLHNFTPTKDLNIFFASI